MSNLIAIKKLKRVLLNRLQENGIEKNKYLLGAVCLNKKGSIISYGFNSYDKTHPKQMIYAIRVNRPSKVFLHAELSALLKVKEKPYSLIVLRMNRSGILASSEPCPICSLAIKEKGIREIIYVNTRSELVIKEVI
jgi:tRNA(Arg) A34 adenosine deaminase TadA